MDKVSFDIGYLMAVANIIHLHEEPTIATDVLRDGQVSRKTLESFDLSEYDVRVLTPLFDDIDRQDKEAENKE
jgi:hypothetical protein